MRRPSAWLILVVILLGAFILREPRLQEVEDLFLSWFMQQSQPLLPAAPVTLVEISRADIQRMPAPLAPNDQTPQPDKDKLEGRFLAPLEYALFLQAVIEFQPAVVAIEPIVLWRDRDKEQEQIFIDQAMRVPKLLVGIELGAKGPRDLSPEDVPSFSQVSGERGRLTEFAGVSRQPDDDIRLISTPGFTNLSEGLSGPVRVPMLFEYRGEIVPSFPLQAILLWLRATPVEVKVELGSQILLPNGWKIPIQRDGTLTLNPAAERSVRRLTLNQLLLAAQEYETHRPPTIDLTNLKNQIVILRISDDPRQPPNVFATAIATIQNHAYVHRAPWAYDWSIVFGAALLGCFLWRISKWNLAMGAIGFSAGYGLVALGLLSKDRVWLPTFLPLCLLWFLVVVRLFAPASAAKEVSS